MKSICQMQTEPSRTQCELYSKACVGACVGSTRLCVGSTRLCVGSTRLCVGSTRLRVGSGKLFRYQHEHPTQAGSRSGGM